MEVILLENIKKLGTFGEIINVKNGFARNYLLPRKKAIIANKNNMTFFENQKAEIEQKNNEMLAEAKKVHATINNAFVVMIRQASEDGKLFGSVTLRDVIEQLNQDKSLSLTKHLGDGLPSIKFIGVHEVGLSLHPEVTANLRIIIARSDFEAEEAKKLFLNPPKKKSDEENVFEKKSKKTKEEASDITESEDESVEEITSSEEGSVSE